MSHASHWSHNSHCEGLRAWGLGADRVDSLVLEPIDTASGSPIITTESPILT